MGVNPWLRRLAWATLVANGVLIVTGGAVRLTGSGLGCPTWPRCDDTSFTPHGALGVHQLIEFGNRTLTFVLVAIAVATFVAARQSGRRDLVRLAVLLALAIPAQAVLGGITVLTDLNPWVVSLHLMLSLGLVSVAVVFLHRLDHPAAPAESQALGLLPVLARTTYAAAWLVLYAGTVVTGAGPHAGDASAPRNGLDPRDLSQIHSDLVFLLIGLTVATAVVVHYAEAPEGVRRAVRAVVLVEVLQAIVGFTQYFTGVPVGLVLLHLLGAGLLMAAVTWLLVTAGQRVSSGSSATATKSSDR